MGHPRASGLQTRMSWPLPQLESPVCSLPHLELSLPRWLLSWPGIPRTLPCGPIPVLDSRDGGGGFSWVRYPPDSNPGSGELITGSVPNALVLLGLGLEFPARPEVGTTDHEQKGRMGFSFDLVTPCGKLLSAASHSWPRDCAFLTPRERGRAYFPLLDFGLAM